MTSSTGNACILHVLDSMNNFSFFKILNLIISITGFHQNAIASSSMV